MRYKSKKLDKPNVEIIFIPRGEGDIVLRAQAILSNEPFEKLCPEPKPPTVLYAGAKEAVPDFTDVGYKEAVAAHGRKYFNWMIFTSLQATDDLEWELVKADDSASWDKVFDELKAAMFSTAEIHRIITGVNRANTLDEGRVEEARQYFLRTQAAQAKQ